MMLLYAVIRAETVIPRLRGVGGETLEVVRSRDAAIVCEECRTHPTADRPTAIHFAGVITEIDRSATVLPVRFPTVLDTHRHVMSELQRRGGGWRRRLKALDGLGEMVVHATWPPPLAAGGSSEPSGGAYLRRRAAVVHSSESVRAQLENTANPCCREIRQLPASRGVRMACLVAPEASPDLRDALRRWEHAVAGRAIGLSGPWPPFSFAAESEEDHCGLTAAYE
jgi:hypothetical protein